MAENRKLVLVYQRTIPQYRRVFFELVGAQLELSDMQLLVATTDPWVKHYSTTQLKYVWLDRWTSLNVSGRDIQETVILPKGLSRLLRQSRPTLSVTEDLSAMPGNLLFPLHRWLRHTPYMIWSLGDAILGKERTWWRHAAVPVIEMLRRGASGFICYSDWAAENLRTKYGKRVHVAYNSAVRQADILREGDLPLSKYDAPRTFRLLFIGRLLAQKKVDILLHALANLPKNIELDVIGDGAERHTLSALSSALGLDSRVRFHGAIHECHRKNALIDSSHLAVLPGLGGLFIQEAYSRGLPVLCGPADGTEQDLVGTVTPDLYLRHVTAGAIALRVRQFAADAAGAKKSARSALQTVRQKYNLENMAARWAHAVLVSARQSRD